LHCFTPPQMKPFITRFKGKAQRTTNFRCPFYMSCGGLPRKMGKRRSFNKTICDLNVTVDFTNIT